MALFSGIVYNTMESLLRLWRRRYNRTVGPDRGPRYTWRRTFFRQNGGRVCRHNRTVGPGVLSWGILRLTPCRSSFPQEIEKHDWRKVAAFIVK